MQICKSGLVISTDEPFGFQLLRAENETRRTVTSSSRQPDETRRQLFVSEGPAAPAGAGAIGSVTREEVAVQGCSVIWSSGSSLRKRFTASSEVLQASWARFNDRAIAVPPPTHHVPQLGSRCSGSGGGGGGSSSDTLCLVQRGHLTTCSSNGELQSAPLVEGVTQAWSLPSGLLLSGASAPTVYLLSHPLEPAHPVIADVSLRAGQAGSFAGFSGEAVVWSSRDLPFVATYSEGAGRLAIWCAEQRPLDLTSLGDLADLPAATPQPYRGAAGHTGGTPMMLQPQQQQHMQQQAGHAGGPSPLPFGAPFAGHRGASMTSGTPMSVAMSMASNSIVGSLAGGLGAGGGGGGGGGGSAVKKPVARTPEGYLSPSMFNPTPRNAHRHRPPLLAGSHAFGGGAGTSGVPPIGAMGVAQAGGPGGTNRSAAVRAGLGCGGTQTVFRLVKEESLAPGMVPLEGHLATDLDGAPLLCVLCSSPQRLVAIRLPSSAHGAAGQTCSVAFSVDATSAAALCATGTVSSRSPFGHLRELLVLRPDGRLILYRGSRPLCEITYRQLLATPTPRTLETAAPPHAGAAVAASAKVAEAPASPVMSLCRMSVGATASDDDDDGDGDDMMMSSSAEVTPVKGARPSSSPMSSTLLGPAAGGEIPTAGQEAAPAAAAAVRSTPQAAAVKAVRLAHAAGRSVVLELSDGRSAQMVMPLASSRPLPSLALAALRAVCDAEVYHRLLQQYYAHPDSCSGHLKHEWAALSSVLLAWAADPTAFMAAAVISGDATSPGPPAAVDAAAAAAAAASAAAPSTPTLLPEAAAARGRELPPFLMNTPQTKRFAAMSLASPLKDAPSVSPWQALLSSDLHAASVASGRMAWLPPAGGCPSPPPVAGSAAHKPMALLASFTFDLGGTTSAHPPASGPSDDRQRQQQQEGLLSALCALHSVYEDCKLDVLRWPLLPVIGATLAQFAVAVGAHRYVDHYVRDIGPDQLAEHGAGGTLVVTGAATAVAAKVGSAPAATATTDTRIAVKQAQPADIHRVLVSLLRGAPPRSEHVPSLVASRCRGVVSRSLRVIACLETLAACSNKCATIAATCAQPGDLAPVAGQLRAAVLGGCEGLVLDMVAQGWTVVELETLPAGVALPLREALQKCRHQPPSGWPVEAYALIGREDIAATLAASEHHRLKPAGTTRAGSGPGAATASGAQLARAHSAKLGGGGVMGGPMNGGGGLALMMQAAAAAGAATMSAASTPTLFYGRPSLQTPAGAGGIGIAVRTPSTQPQQQQPFAFHPHALAGQQVGSRPSLPPSPPQQQQQRSPALGGMAGMGSLFNVTPVSTVAPTVGPAGGTTAAAQAASYGGGNAPLFGGDTRRGGGGDGQGRVAPTVPPGVPPAVQSDETVLRGDGSRTPYRNWYRWRMPYAQRLQLPAHFLDAVPALGTSDEQSGGDVGRGSQGGAGGGMSAMQKVKAKASDEEGGVMTGMEGLHRGAARLRFGRDGRLQDVENLLDTSKPVVLRLDVAEDDPNVTAKKQAHLLCSAQRSMVMPLGRGALTLFTSRPLPTEPVEWPSLCLSGTVYLGQNTHFATVVLDLSHEQVVVGAAADVTAWPEFHNGAAAGLRLASELGSQLSRTWVVYHRREKPNWTHAGLLLGLGLTGHLGKLAWTDLYRYLSDQHDATTIGLMLGMAATRRCSMDPVVSKMLFLHVPARHPYAFPEIELSPLVQASALLGVGLLYQGSCHRLMAEIMLEEIGRRPGPLPVVDSGAPLSGPHIGGAVTQDREGYALAAGFALGLITLGRGRAAVGLADLQIEDRLRSFMLGGSEASCSGTAGGGPARSTAPLGMATVFDKMSYDPALGEERRSLLAGRLSLPPRADAEREAMSGVSQVVLEEGQSVNLAITSPAATMALALMYLRTHDDAIAARFVIPDTSVSLDYVRPDYILLRLLGRSLVMWDDVQPDVAWVAAQLPRLYREPVSVIMARMARRRPGVPDKPDLLALALAHIHAVAGLCLAIGLKYAGSCDSRAYATLHHYALALMDAKRKAPESPGDASLRRLDKAPLEACLGCVVLALSVVMAGSGHLGTFKLIRVLSTRKAPLPPPNGTASLNYGAHMALSMAAGFLFMSAGNATFGTSDGAVAALLISLYPRFPLTTTDNRCHLQAFRHLYVLAAEPRCVEAVDVDSQSLVYVPLAVTLDLDATAPGQQRAGQQDATATTDGPGPAGGPGCGASGTTSHGAAPHGGMGGTAGHGTAAPDSGQAAGGGERELGGGLDGQRTPTEWEPTHSILRETTRGNMRDPWSLAASPISPSVSPAHFAGGTADVDMALRGAGGTPPSGDFMTPTGASTASAQAAAAAAAAVAAPGDRSIVPTAGGGRSRQDGATFSRIAPCLLPEQSQVQRVEVCGPRYWSQVLDRQRLPEPLLHHATIGLDVTGGTAGRTPGGTAGGTASSASPDLLPAGITPRVGAASLQPFSPFAPATAGVQQQPPPPGTTAYGWHGGGGMAAAAAAAVAAGGHNDDDGTSALSRIYGQQLVFVKKKAGSLSYADDPSGIRSLLSRAFHGGSTLGQDISAADQVQRHSMGLVHLCATFSVDPAMMGYAQHIRRLADLQAAREAEGGGAAAAEGVGAAAAAAAALLESSPQSVERHCSDLLEFCHSTLYECITQEKMGALAVYLQLYCLVHHMVQQQPTTGQGAVLKPGGSSTVALWGLKLALEHYNSGIAIAAAAAVASPAGVAGDATTTTSVRGATAPAAVSPCDDPAERLLWQPLLQPTFLESLWKLLQRSWRDKGFLSSLSSSSSNGTGAQAPFRTSFPGGTSDAWASGTSGTPQGRDGMPGSCSLGHYVQDGWAPAAAPTPGETRPTSGSTSGSTSHATGGGTSRSLGALDAQERAAFATCLAMNDIPSACDVAAAWERVQPLIKQLAGTVRRQSGDGGTGGTGSGFGDAAALAPLLAAFLPGTSFEAAKHIAHCLMTPATLA